MYLNTDFKDPHQFIYLLSQKEIKAAVDGLLQLRYWLDKRDARIGFEATIAGFKITSID